MGLAPRPRARAAPLHPVLRESSQGSRFAARAPRALAEAADRREHALASYHFSVQVVSRGGGRSSVACAAYRAAERLTCERDGLVHDYIRKQGVLHSEIVLPEHAPERWLDRSTLWNEVEATERRADAQLARETVFAVPHELTREQQVEFCRETVRALYASRGMVCDWALHDADGDGHNVHCHVLCPLRSCDESGFLAKSENVYTVRAPLAAAVWSNDTSEADRERAIEDAAKKANGAEFKELKEFGYEKVYKYRRGNEWRQLTATEAGYDENAGFKRASKNAVQEARYLNDWNDPGNVEKWRAEFCGLQNAALERAGSAARVDHRSYERQGIERIAQRHEGPQVRAIERKAGRAAAEQGREYAPVTDRAAENAAVREHNAILARVEATIAAMRRQVEELRGRGREAMDDFGQRLAQEQQAWRDRVDAARQRMASFLKPPTLERQREASRTMAAQGDRRLDAYRQRLSDPATRLKPAMERARSFDKHRDLTPREKSFMRPEQLSRYEKTRTAEVKEAERAKAAARARSQAQGQSQGASRPAPAQTYEQTPSRGIGR